MWSYLPPACEVWGKVMFSQACVILFTGEEGAHPPMDAPQKYELSPQDGYTLRQKTDGQQASGTHPTGIQYLFRIK